jgi:hypothetical protein
MKYGIKRKPLTKAQRQQVYDKTEGHCAYCGTLITIEQMQADHIAAFEYAHIMEAQGNDPNSIDNYLPACRSCNYIKDTLPLEKFRNTIEYWPETLRRDSVTFRNALRFGIVKVIPQRVVFYFEKIGLQITDYLSGLNEIYRQTYGRAKTIKEEVDNGVSV